MTQVHFFSLVAILVFGTGFYGLIIYHHLLKKIMAVNIMASGVFIFFIAIARRGEQIDPVPHAMVLTGLVISVSATAYALALLKRIDATTEQFDNSAGKTK